MGSIQKVVGKVGASFIAEVRRRRGLASPVRLTKRFKRKSDASAWIRATEALLDSGKGVKAPSRVTLDEAINRYRTDKLPLKSKRTQIVQRGQLNWFSKNYGSHRLSAFDPDFLSKIRTALLGEILPTSRSTESPKSRDPQTVNRYFQLLGHLFEVAKSEWGLVEEAPRLPKLRERPKARPPLAVGQLKLLLEHFRRSDDKRVYLITLIAMLTGARLGEICALRWSNIDLDGRRIHFVENTKGDTQRTLPIPSVLVTELSAHKALTPGDFAFPAMRRSKRGYTYDWATKQVRATMRRLGIKGNFHSLRHTVASLATNNGVPTRQTQQLLGHRSVSTTELYSHVRSEHLRPIVEDIECRIFTEVSDGPSIH